MGMAFVMLQGPEATLLAPKVVAFVVSGAPGRDAIDGGDLAAHEAGTDVHSIAGVAGLQAALDSKQIREQLVPLGDVSGMLTLDMQSNSGRCRFTATATGDLTIEFANIPPGVQSITLDLTAGGDHIITYAGTVALPADGAPELTSDTDVLVFETIDGGTTWKLFAAGEGYS